MCLILWGCRGARHPLSLLSVVSRSEHSEPACRLWLGMRPRPSLLQGLLEGVSILLLVPSPGP